VLQGNAINHQNSKAKRSIIKTSGEFFAGEFFSDQLFSGKLFSGEFFQRSSEQ
jgi:hypothetical protein